MLSLFILTPSVMLATASVTAQAAPPTVKQSQNGEFMTKYYPHDALTRGEQGRVAFELTADREGKLTSCVVTQSSGHATLDRETCDFLTSYARLKAGRDAAGRTVSTTTQGYINWQLPKGAKPVALASQGSAALPEKQICRRYPRPGSKVANVKVCLTKHEWAMREEHERDRVNGMQASQQCTTNPLLPPAPCN